MSLLNVPREIRDLPQWVCWKYENRGGEKPTKVPYSPETDQRASVVNPSTWSSFATATKSMPRYDGVGFVITKDDPYTLIDLDDPKGDAKTLDFQKSIL